MPATLVDRLPLPSLRVYTAGSVLLVSMAMWHAVSVTVDPAWKVNATLQSPEAGADARNVSDQVVDVVTFMIQDPLCMWTLINMSYCVVAVGALRLQSAVFGPLRVAEAARVRDRFWNYVFYKFIFVFGVLDVQYMDEVLVWCAWFTLIGLLHLMAQLANDRFEYVRSGLCPVPVGTVVGLTVVVGFARRWFSARGNLALSSSVSRGVGPGSSCSRLVSLSGGVAASGAAMLTAAAAALLPTHLALFAFTAAECVLVVALSLRVVARYWLLRRAVDAHAPLAYYTHLAFDTVSVSVELAHTLHMTWAHRLALSLPSLVLLLQLRHLLHRLQQRRQRHLLYTATQRHMTTHYPMASPEELDKNQDNCAICWEPLKEARKLPCHHLFHNSCLCQWMQQDASCPTCRRPLRPPAAGAQGAAGGAAVAAPAAPAAPPPPDRLFHFDGSRYVSWLPSFSVEVTRVRAPSEPRLQATAAQVQQMFPHYPMDTLTRDLAITRSADVTIDNILEGRLQPPPPPPPTPPPSRSPTTAFTPVTSSHTSRSSETELSLNSFAQTHPILDVSSSEQFPSSAEERQTTLQRRKEILLANARVRYLSRQQADGFGARADPNPTPHS